MGVSLSYRHTEISELKATYTLRNVHFKGLKCGVGPVYVHPPARIKYVPYVTYLP